MARTIQSITNLKRNFRGTQEKKIQAVQENVSVLYRHRITVCAVRLRKIAILAAVQDVKWDIQ